jgi:hypothetical protein
VLGVKVAVGLLHHLSDQHLLDMSSFSLLQERKAFFLKQFFFQKWIPLLPTWGSSQHHSLRMRAWTKA